MLTLEEISISMISILSNFVNEVAHILKYQVVHSYKGIEKLKGT